MTRTYYPTPGRVEALAVKARVIVWDEEPAYRAAAERPALTPEGEDWMFQVLYEHVIGWLCEKAIEPDSENEAKAVEEIIKRQLLQVRGETPEQKRGRISSLLWRELHGPSYPNSVSLDDAQFDSLLEKVLAGLEREKIVPGSGKEHRYIERAARNSQISEWRKADAREWKRQKEEQKKARAARYRAMRKQYAFIIRRLVGLYDRELVPYLDKFFGERDLQDIAHREKVSVETGGKRYRKLKELLTGKEWCQDFPDRVQRALEREKEELSEFSSPDGDSTYDD
jgi:hypothetical protein